MKTTEVDWRKMYILMVDAADKAVEMIERKETERAVTTLINAMNACEDIYIGEE